MEAAVGRLMDLLQLFFFFIHVLIMMCYHLVMKYMLFTIHSGIWIKFTSKTNVLYKDFLLGCILVIVLNVMQLFGFWICDYIYLRMYTLFTRKLHFFHLPPPSKSNLNINLNIWFYTHGFLLLFCLLFSGGLGDDIFFPGWKYSMFVLVYVIWWELCYYIAFEFFSHYFMLIHLVSSFSIQKHGEEILLNSS